MNIVTILLLAVTAANALKFTMELSSSGPLLSRLMTSGNYTEYLESRNRRRFDLRALNQQTLSDYFDQYYIGAVNIGTPPQTLYLSMDTGSSNVWVIDSACSQKQCAGYPSSYRPKIKFSPSASKTFKKITQGFSMKYNTGSASGYYGTDTVRFAGLKVEKQKFGVATAIADVFGNQPIDGIFGLGWPALATDKIKTPLEAILPDLDEKSFTVWMGRRTTTSYGQSAGSIVFGARDSTHCNNATQWVPLSKKGYWQFQIKQFQIGQYIWKSTDEVTQLEFVLIMC
ncbi:eukaryotic aspartyl protease [Ancylostoma caninum]|uniref:Eukaryotic aspartyl protease n=1 Tax=Ancylostoma caninum TaxID=29170 RepID=A0A368FLA8_ANCCA|nr:eukaryotic aspartyl protease [Ancylostoma caninum]